MKFALALLTLTLAVSSTLAQELDRPTIPTLFLSKPGDKPVREVALVSFTEVQVCLSDYPNGFSIRCEVTTSPGFRTVVFRVNTQIRKKQYFAPYYLAGDTAIKVRPFYFGANRDRLRIACRVRTRKPVWVDLIKC